MALFQAPRAGPPLVVQGSVGNGILYLPPSTFPHPKREGTPTPVSRRHMHNHDVVRQDSEASRGITVTFDTLDWPTRRSVKCKRGVKHPGS